MTNSDVTDDSDADDHSGIPERPRVSIADGVLRIVVATAANGTSLDIDSITAGAAALAAATSAPGAQSPNGSAPIDHTDGSAVGAVLLVGEGANFCAGGNVRSFAAAPERGAFVKQTADAFHAFVRALAATTVPVVAGVQGWAAGAGMSIVCHTDVAIGGRSTKMRPAYPGIGFTPDGGLTWTLPRIVGAARARDILLNDTIVNGEEAVRLGILSRLVGDEIIGSEAERLARALAAGPTSSFRGIKALLDRSENNTLAAQLEAEAQSIAVAADSATGREGVDAFIEKRRPDFS